MVDIEKELGPLFEKLEKEGKLERYRKRDQRIVDEHNEFKDMCDALIAPLMRDYQRYLRKKGIYSDIVKEPKIDMPTIPNPSISFVLTDFNLLSPPGVYPSIKFTLEGEKILETITGKTTFSIEYLKNQVTPDLITNKITNLIKSCLETL
ncbi:MAG TPA: hypothetical protein VLD84_07725 [Nitrososphaeraceae archaeon]|nr:hypothetical protein [Nitrososphaeraceae archaeon]